MEYIKMLPAFKVAASIIFLWVHSPYNNSYNFGNNLENLCNVEIISDIRFQRSLAKHVVKKELDRSKIRNVISENNKSNNVKCTSDDLSEYAKLKKKGLNDLEIYKEEFKRNYAKSKGLKGLDCYFEKKIFDMIDRISGQQVESSSYNKKLKKSIVRKGSMGVIVMCLIPLIGIVLDILSRLKILKTELLPDYAYVPIFIFLLILTFIILYSIIYTMKKIIKYERLEAGRGKLKSREYRSFCKDVFLPKRNS